MDRRVWIGMALGVLAGIGISQAVVLPRERQSAAIEAAEAARRAEAGARAAAEAARKANERRDDPAAARDVTGKAPAVSR